MLWSRKIETVQGHWIWQSGDYQDFRRTGFNRVMAEVKIQLQEIMKEPEEREHRQDI